MPTSSLKPRNIRWKHLLNLSSTRQTPRWWGWFCLCLVGILVWTGACSVAPSSEPEPSDANGESVISTEPHTPESLNEHLIKPDESAKTPEPSPEPRADTAEPPEPKPEDGGILEPVQDTANPTETPGESDGGVETPVDGADGGVREQEPSIEAGPPEWPVRDDICKGQRPCMTTYAGPPWDREGPALAPWFTRPTLVVSDKKGKLYIWDDATAHLYELDLNTQKMRLVYRIQQTPPFLDSLCGIVLDSQGYLYVSQQYGYFTGIRKMDVATGKFVDVAGGLQRGYKDGPGSQAQFEEPCGLGFDSKGNLYVADHSRIRKIDANGNVSTFAGTGVAGYKDGPANQAQFNYVKELVIDSQDNLYTCEKSCMVIRKITQAGVVSLVYGTNPSQLRQGELAGLALDANNVLYVTNPADHTIEKVQGTTRTVVVGTGYHGYTEGPALQARLAHPRGLAFGANGALYIAQMDSTEPRIRKLDFTTNVVSTTAGAYYRGGKDGAADQALFGSLSRLTLDPKGNLYVTDIAGFEVRKIDAQRIVSTVAKKATGGDIEADSFGNYYLAAGTVIFKHDSLGQSTVFCGNGVSNYVDGSPAQASFVNAWGMTFGPGGFLYVGDGYLIRKVDLMGNVSTYAGVPNSSSPFLSPVGLAFDNKGNLFVADYEHYIAKVDPQGKASVYAGIPNGFGYVDGPVAQARFQEPCDIAADNDGNVYVTEKFFQRIRKIDAKGMVSTMFWSIGGGFFNGLPQEARFDRPCGIVFDGKDALYVAEENNGRIRKILLK